MGEAGREGILASLFGVSHARSLLILAEGRSSKLARDLPGTGSKARRLGTFGYGARHAGLPLSKQQASIHHSVKTKVLLLTGYEAIFSRSEVSLCDLVAQELQFQHSYSFLMPEGYKCPPCSMSPKCSSRPVVMLN
jgi:hypothetical protein